MVRLRALGALDLRDADGREIRGVLAQPKRAALFAYLALATPRGPRRRDTLLALFWPEQDDERARNALSQAVHFLRRTLGPDVLVTGSADEVSVRSAELWCDAIAFEDALDTGRLVEALELYRGELLEGVHISNAPEFERWVDAERTRLGTRFVRAVEEVAAERSRAGDFAAAVAHWRRLATRDPYSSRAALGLMRAMASAEDPAGAVRHARIHETLLREELGVSADPEVNELVRQLQAPAPSPAAGRSVVRPRFAEPEQASPRGSASAATHPPASNRKRRMAILLAGILALGAAAAGLVAKQGGLSASSPPIRAIAVLPFKSLSGTATDQVFADGMHDALVTELSRYPELGVTSRTSAIQYRGSDKSLSEIARELDVDGVFEGTLLREGGRVRVTGNLFHGPSDRSLWGQAYDRDLRDILSLQAELAAAIAREVRVAAHPLNRATRKVSGPRDSVPRELQLRDIYNRGRHAEVSRTPVGMDNAISYYRHVIEQDSSFALGYAGLSEAWALKAHYDFAPKRIALDSARIAAQRALALDSLLPEARTALAVSLANDGRFADAEREFRRAIELAPSHAPARYWYGMLLVSLGRGPEALDQATTAVRLDPLGPRAVLSTQRYARYLITGDRPHMKEPVSARRPILKIESGEPWARAREAVEFAEEGSCSEGRSRISRARNVVSDSNRVMLAFAAMVDWSCGERERARDVLATMTRHPEANDHGLRIAILHARFGEHDAAFRWLERHRWTVSELAVLRGDVMLDPLRPDPRFTGLLQKLRLQELPTSAASPSR